MDQSTDTSKTDCYTTYVPIRYVIVLYRISYAL